MEQPTEIATDMDHAMLVKLYGEAPESAKGWYSPAECIGTRDCREIGGQAAAATCGSRSLAAQKRCPKPVPSVPFYVRCARMRSRERKFGLYGFPGR